MATTDLGNRLTAAQRAAQIQLRTATVRDLLRIWQIFDPADIGGSWAKLEPVLVALIQSRFPMSAQIAARYLPEYRRAEQITGSIIPTIPDTPLTDAIVPNLRYVGPKNALKLHELGRQPSQVARITLSNIEGELARQILNGGRATIVETTHRDPQARGIARITDGSPCSFCALLASRGAVYLSEETASFDAHRKCGCTAEPSYHLDAPLSPKAQGWAQIYDEAARSVPRSTPDRAAAVRREFRRLYESVPA